MELAPIDRRWLAEAGVPLDDPRVVPVYVPGVGIGFDIAGACGLVRIRFDAAAVTVGGARVVADPDGPNGVGVEFPPGTPVDPSNWLPWVVTEGPSELVGARWDDVAVAVAAALHGSSRVPGLFITDEVHFEPYQRRNDPGMWPRDAEEGWPI